MTRAVLEDIFAAAEAKAPLETGGMLVGYVGVDPSAVVVTGAIPAGPGATEEIDAFKPNGAWQQRKLERIYYESVRLTTFLGDWHSHPDGLPAPSGKDVRTARKVSRTRSARMKEPLTLIAAKADDGRWTIAGYRYQRWRLRPVLLRTF